MKFVEHFRIKEIVANLMKLHTLIQNKWNCSTKTFSALQLILANIYISWIKSIPSLLTTLNESKII